MTLAQAIIGVDVAKDWIDTCDSPSGQRQRIFTTGRALASLCAMRIGRWSFSGPPAALIARWPGR